MTVYGKLRRFPEPQPLAEWFKAQGLRQPKWLPKKATD